MPLLDDNQRNMNQAVQLRYGLKELRESKNWCDVKITSNLDGQSISAHRIVLAACSDYFKAMFTCGLTESSQTEVRLYLHGDELVPLINYCYSGEIEITAENVRDLMCAASMLLMHEIEDQCSRFIKKILSAENCLGFRDLAYLLSREKLLIRANGYAFEFFEEVSKNMEFLGLKTESLLKLLGSNELNVASEEVVCTAGMAWLRYQSSKVISSELFRNIFEQVRLPLLSASYLEDFVKPFCIKNGLLDALKAATNQQQLPGGTVVLERMGRPKVLALSRNSLSEFLKVESYCPLMDYWSSIATVNSRMYDFDAVVFNGELVFVGGWSEEQDFHGMESFNLKTKTRTHLTPMLATRKSLCAAVLDGKIYAVSGFCGVMLHSAERYDPATKTWEYVAPIPTARTCAAAAVLDGRLYVVGGSGADKEIYATTECYDPETDEWSAKADLIQSRQRFSVVENGGFLYAVGGDMFCTKNTVERYNPLEDSWNIVFALNAVMCVPYGAFMPGNRLTMVVNKFKGGPEMVVAVEQYDVQEHKLKHCVEKADDPNYLFDVLSYP